MTVESAPGPARGGAPATGALHHVEIYVRDLEAANHFWSWLLARLGYEPYQEWDEGFAWRRGDAYLMFVGAPEPAGRYDRRAVGLNHLAFHAATEAEVDAITRELRERDVRILYEDRHPHAGGDDHYAVFVEDPEGIKVEVVARSP